MSALRLINQTTLSGGSSVVNIDNVFSSDFDIYKLVVSDFVPNNSENLLFRLINSSGTALTDSSYDIATQILRNNASSGEVRVTNTTYWTYGGYVTSTSTQGFGLEMYIYNPFSSTSYTFASLSSINGASADIGNKNIYVYKQLTSVRGLQLTNAYSSLKNLTARIYGLRVDS